MSNGEFIFFFIVSLLAVVIWGLTRSKKEQNEMYRKQFMPGFERDFYTPEEIEAEEKRLKIERGETDEKTEQQVEQLVDIEQTEQEKELAELKLIQTYEDPWQREIKEKVDRRYLEMLQKIKSPYIWSSKKRKDEINQQLQEISQRRERRGRELREKYRNFIKVKKED